MEFIKNSEFNATLSSNKLVVVLCTASWCKPCEALKPIVYSIAASLTNIKFVMIDVDAESDLAARLGIRGIPTLLFFKDGELFDRLVGNSTRSSIVNVISRF